MKEGREDAVATGYTPGGYREALQVAWPLIISTGSFTLMQFVDRMFLAWHSSTSIQAALPAGILSFTLACGFMALAGYANTFVAQYHGAGDKEGCSRSTAQGVWLALLSFPLLLLLIPVGDWILRLSAHPPEVLREELTYFRILMAGSISIPLNAAISSFFTGRGDTRTNMVAGLVGNVVNIVLDYAWIFGHFGFPALGIAGAAYATIVAGFVSPLILFALYFGKTLRRTYNTVATFRFERELFMRLIRFGLPSGIQLFLDVSSFSVFVLFTGRMGELALAVSNMAFSINMVAFMPLIGISIAASTLVGQYQGRRDAATAEKAGWTCFKIGVLYMTFVAITYLALPRFYFGLFMNRAEGGLTMDDVMPLGRYLLAMMAAWGILDAANLIVSGALKGAGDSRFVMLYSSIGAWCVLVPVQWAMVRWFNAGILASWAWLTIYIMLLSSGFLLRFRSGAWKSIEVIEQKAPIVPRAPGAESIVLSE